MTVIPRTGYDWSTYKEAESRGLLDDVPKKSWNDECKSQAYNISETHKLTGTFFIGSNLHFISHVPNHVHGDQLVAQLYRCIPERSWLFRYGRVPMSLILAESLWEVSSVHRPGCTHVPYENAF